MNEIIRFCVLLLIFCESYSVNLKTEYNRKIMDCDWELTNVNFNDISRLIINRTASLGKWNTSSDNVVLSSTITGPA
jgi:hypothetical protein